MKNEDTTMTTTYGGAPPPSLPNDVGSRYHNVNASLASSHGSKNSLTLSSSFDSEDLSKASQMSDVMWNIQIWIFFLAVGYWLGRGRGALPLPFRGRSRSLSPLSERTLPCHVDEDEVKSLI